MFALSLLWQMKRSCLDLVICIFQSLGHSHGFSLKPLQRFNLLNCFTQPALNPAGDKACSCLITLCSYVQVLHHPYTTNPSSWWHITALMLSPGALNSWRVICSVTFLGSPPSKIAFAVLAPFHSSSHYRASLALSFLFFLPCTSPITDVPATNFVAHSRACSEK